MDKQNPQEYTNVLLEDMRAKFNAFGDGLALLREKAEANFERLGTLSEDVQIIKIEIFDLKERVSKIEARLLGIERKAMALVEDVKEIKKEVKEIKEKLDQKVSTQEFLNLKSRVERLENYVRKHFLKTKQTSALAV